MRRTELQQQLRKMRFDTAYDDWRSGRLTQEEAARLLNVHERTFRRYIDRYHEEGQQGLLDKRISEVSRRRAPADEVLRLETLYKSRYDGWKVKHFYSFYKNHHCGSRSYTWVKNRLQSAGLVAKAKGKGRHRKRRERSPMPSMMLHQARYNLFQLVHSLYEYRSIVLTTNKDFTDWGEFFAEDQVAVPVIDRIIHHSHIFKLGGESYRLKEKTAG